jgi:hypothetical protein
MMASPPLTEPGKTYRPAEDRGRNRFLLGAVAVLAIALVSLGAWTAYDQISDSSTVPVEITELIDEYVSAWEARDEAAFRGMVTPDFLLTEYIYEIEDGETSLYNHVSDDIDNAVRVNFLFEWEIEQLVEPSITGDGPWFVSVGQKWVQNNWHQDGMSTFSIVNDGGTMKISSHYWTALRYLVLPD